MQTAYCQGSFLASLVLTTVYLFMWHKHFDTHITLIFVLVPITNLGFVLLYGAQTLEGALFAKKLVYIGGCYLILISMLAVFSLCHIQVNRWVRAVLLSWSSIVYLHVLSIGTTDDFYRNISFRLVDGMGVLTKEYGPWHALFVVTIMAYFCTSFVAMGYSYARKKQVSRKTIQLLFISQAVCVASFVGSKMLPIDVELLPMAYTTALLINLAISWRIGLYDVTDTAIDSLVQTGETGFVSLDFAFRYLGSNETAKRAIPQLRDLTVDKALPPDSLVFQMVLGWVKEFAAGKQTPEDALWEREGRIYRVSTRFLYTEKRRRGYQLIIQDDTENQRYIQLLGTYNEQLQSEVAQKTAHIVEMHDNLVLSMAMMVESRDNSTGGHIRRTSEGVRLLIEQIRRLGEYDLSETFCRDVVKAAPMHDLGKIAVDDAVLRKPGRFTPEEFQKMKAHAAEGARIVSEILRDTDDEEFKRVAEHVAHYHHERWDGTGYPEGLMGEDIPLEARIMAIADVYDALVSKRVYKEAMSFERADAIIMDGMGTQFDPSLQAAYVAARPFLEEYYCGLAEGMSNARQRADEHDPSRRCLRTG